MRLNTASRIGLVAAFIAVLGLCVAIGTAFAHDKATYDLIPEETYIAGINVSGMTADEATQVVSAYAASHASDFSISLTDPDTGISYPLGLSAGVTYDVETAVALAVERNHNTPVLTRVLSSLADSQAERVDIDLSYTVDKSAVSDGITTLASMIHVDAANAWREFNDDNTVVVHPEVVGRDLDVEATTTAATAAIQQVLDSSSSLSELASASVEVPMTVITTQPEVTVSGMPYSVIIDYSKYMLYVFDGETMIYSVMIGYGRGWEDGVNYSSPSDGLHYVEYFDRAPTWTNPSPNGWGKDYEAFYAAGDPENPLGSRAIKVSDAPLVFIHGVNNAACIGNRLSHGCINVWDSDVIVLFQLLYDSAVEKDSLSVGGTGEPVWIYFHDYPG